MSESNSTTSTATDKPATGSQGGVKPAKPYADFPLFPHATGRWAKKIRGKLHYFGKWSDGWQAAIDSYNAQKEALHAGRRPRATPDTLTVKDLCNAFLRDKLGKVSSGELSPLTMTDYKAAAGILIKFAGGRRIVEDLRPSDLAELRASMAKRWGPHRLKKNVQYIRSILKYAYDAELIDKTIRMGTGFKCPTQTTMRLHKARQGAKLFTRDEIHRMLDAAEQPLKAMILLGINCGFGNSDCANLPTSAVDLETAWADFPRPKTGIARRCPLWPETVAAIRDALAARPAPKDANNAGLVFITKYGGPWGKEIADSPVSKETAKLLKELHINGRKRLNFYTLRHTFRTVADEAKDQPACNHIMGHEPPEMATHYRERIDDARLKAVVDHVRGWLFGGQAAKE
jgi:integrase